MHVIIYVNKVESRYDLTAMKKAQFVRHGTNICLIFRHIYFQENYITNQLIIIIIMSLCQLINFNIFRTNENYVI